MTSSWWSIVTVSLCHWYVSVKKVAVTALPFQPALLPSYPHWKRKFNFAKSIYARMCHWNFKSLSNDHVLSRIDLGSVIFVRQNRVFLLFSYFYLFFFLWSLLSPRNRGKQKPWLLYDKLGEVWKGNLGVLEFPFFPKKTLT